MYESPIDQFTSAVQAKLEKDLMCEVSQIAGYEVDKEELIKALKYDRDQYNKGYEDAKEAFLHLIKSCVSIPSLSEWDSGYNTAIREVMHKIENNL